MTTTNKSSAIQRVAVGLLFLGVSVGVLYLLLFVPMPPDNEKPIMLVIGGIMTAGSMALMRLVQGGDDELHKRDEQITKLQGKLTALEHRLIDRDKLIQSLIDRLEVRAYDSAPEPQRRIERKT